MQYLNNMDHVLGMAQTLVFIIHMSDWRAYDYLELFCCNAAMVGFIQWDNNVRELLPV